MDAAAARLDYEQAAHWRDLIRTIEQIKERPRFISVGLEDTDIFGLARDRDKVGLYVFFMRQGKVREAEELVIREPEGNSTETLLTRLLTGFYDQSEDVPGQILLSHAPAALPELSRRISGKKGALVADPCSPERPGQEARGYGRAECRAAAEESRAGHPAVSELAGILRLDKPPAASRVLTSPIPEERNPSGRSSSLRMESPAAASTGSTRSRASPGPMMWPASAR